ncbi:hypothetical protein [Stenotrophomonas oahuensis]|uniref:Uncharacterized protein n=1 Tax=Stenotrophomonas oahuensis TaxID=3003271 RepID=A0ABY9YUY9_9GAMM|nr:hypothetical protein [Stenotrophomonas sp. A5586]WNH54805.1 hypothetical protein PDM29_20895 [Stenotrophomonas sp. A5586]
MVDAKAFADLIREFLHQFPERDRVDWAAAFEAGQQLIEMADSLDPSIEPKFHSFTAGQVVQMLSLFSRKDVEMPPADQPVVVIRHDPQGEAGPGLYARRNDEGFALHLDGVPGRRK